MYRYIQEYKSYLENDCRYTEETVVSYLGNLPLIFDRLKIQSLADIDSQKVSAAWRLQRWEPIQKGIQISERAESGALPAFKEFLRYLRDRGYLGKEIISGIIHIPEQQPTKLRGLNAGEQARLHEFLRFNVANDYQRRDTALLLLLLSSGCQLDEALALNVHPDGKIDLENDGAVSGDFRLHGETLQVCFGGIDDPDWEMKLPGETAAYLNFYLENRSQRSPMLFINNRRRGVPLRLTVSAAGKMVENVLEIAGIHTRKGYALAVLRHTALANGGGGEMVRTRRVITRNSSDTGSVANARGQRPAARVWRFSEN